MSTIDQELHTLITVALPPHRVRLTTSKIPRSHGGLTYEPAVITYGPAMDDEFELVLEAPRIALILLRALETNRTPHIEMIIRKNDGTVMQQSQWTILNAETEQPVGGPGTITFRIKLED